MEIMDAPIWKFWLIMMTDIEFLTSNNKLVEMICTDGTTVDS